MKDSTYSQDISVVVCVKNFEEGIEACLKSIQANSPKEIIVVDGLSSDSTVELSKKYTDIIISDEGKGPGVAGTMGIARASGAYVAYVGADNILESDSLEKMAEAMHQNDWMAVSTGTRFLNPQTYLERCIDRYKALRYTPGERNALGSPFICERSAFEKYWPEDINIAWSTPMFERALQDGKKMGIADLVVYEIGTASLSYVLFRWVWYGVNDVDVWWIYSKDWSLTRKLYSISHPLRNELIHPGIAAIKKGDITLLPFLCLITALRYYGWIKAFVLGKSKSVSWRAITEANNR